MERQWNGRTSKVRGTNFIITARGYIFNLSVHRGKGYPRPGQNAPPSPPLPLGRKWYAAPSSANTGVSSSALPAPPASAGTVVRRGQYASCVHTGLFCFNGSFTLLNTDTDTDKMCPEPHMKLASVSVYEQYEYLRTILYNPFLSALRKHTIKIKFVNN